MNKNLFEYLYANKKYIDIPKNLYHVYEEDCVKLKNIFISNTELLENNVEGEKTAIFYYKDLNKIVIDGHNSTIIIHGILTPFLFINCKNIYLKNFIIEYENPTMIEMMVESSNEEETVLKLDSKRTNFYIKNNDIFFYSKHNDINYWDLKYKNDNVLAMMYSPKNRQLRFMPRYDEKDKSPSLPNIEKINKFSNERISVSFKNKQILENGSIISLRSISRKEIGGAFLFCKNIKLENVLIHNSNGMGLVFSCCKDITLNYVSYIPLDNFVITSNADFYHFSCCRGKIKVINCTAIGAHDDVINIHGINFVITSVDYLNKSVIAKFSHSATCGFNPFRKGDLIEFVNNENLKMYYTSRIKEAILLDNFHIKIKLDKLPQINIKINKDAINDISANPRGIIKNNSFMRVASRAILCTTRKKVIIENNVLQDIAGPVLYVADDCNFWFESGRSGTIIFKNNLIKNCCYAIEDFGPNIIQYDPIVLDKRFKEFIHKNLLVMNNKFENLVNSKYYFVCDYLNEAKIKNNEFNFDIEIKSKTNTKIICDFKETNDEKR